MEIAISIHGDKLVVENLHRLNAALPVALQRSMSRASKGIHRQAYSFLSGAGGIYEDRASKKTGKAWRKKTGTTPSGGYPVPVRTGNLRRLLDFVEPGQSKSSGGSTFTAGPMQAIVYNSAEYARVIHEGLGSSAKFNPRRYLLDGLKRFNEGSHIVKIVQEEIRREIRK
jgi:hypothetical protein